MINWLSFGLLITPALVGIGLLSVARRVSPATALHLTLAVLALAMLCAMGLTAYVDQALPLHLVWLPGTGAMTLHIGTTGLYTALFTVSCAFLLCLAALPTPSSPSISGVLLIALSAANVAFLSGHFLGRYVALEIVGACIAAAPLLALHNDVGTRLAKSVYLLLRLGDAGFLVAILILMTRIGTLDITPALESGLTLDIPHLNWAIAGFVLAVWVKVGAWPFHSWLHAGHKLPLDARVWLYATAMPNLGLYLLYRITPLLGASLLQPWILGLSIGAALIASVLAIFQTDNDTRLTHINAAQGALALCIASAGLKPAIWLFLPVLTLLRPLFSLANQARQHAPTPARRRWGAGGVVLAGCALTGMNALLLWWLAQAGTIPRLGHYILDIIVVLVGYAALRAAIRGLLRDPRDAKHSVKPKHLDWAPEAAIGVLSLLTLLAILGIGPLLRVASHIVHSQFPPLPRIFTFIWHWGTKPALWLALVALAFGERFYHPSSRAGTAAQTSERALLSFAQALRHWVEQGVLEWVVTELPRSILSGATMLHRLVEQRGLEGALHAIAQVTLFTSRQLQRWHTGRLRANLAWVVGTLVLLVTALVLRGW